MENADLYLSKEYCTVCDKEIEGEILEDDYCNPFCGLRCQGEYEAQQEEAAWDRYVSRFYGGEVTTAKEQYERAYTEKRRVS